MNAEPIVIKNRDFFDNKPQLTPIPHGEENPFTSLFAQLEELSNVDINTLQQLLESIGDEADRISEKKFPDQLRIPQLLSRYKVFQTRLGIVRYTNPLQYADSTFVKAMDDVVISWNIFADHFIRFSTTTVQAQVLAPQIYKPPILYKDRKRL
ncbi:MAG: hypothetical protein VX790_00480 [Bacteroidota bacterium]|nr:hypothetical protein [Bacteroidota bacterium]